MFQWPLASQLIRKFRTTANYAFIFAVRPRPSFRQAPTISLREKPHDVSAPHLHAQPRERQLLAAVERAQVRLHQLHMLGVNRLEPASPMRRQRKHRHPPAGQLDASRPRAAFNRRVPSLARRSKPPPPSSHPSLRSQPLDDLGDVCFLTTQPLAKCGTPSDSFSSFPLGLVAGGKMRPRSAMIQAP